MHLRGNPQTFRIRLFGLASDASGGLLGQDLRWVKIWGIFLVSQSAKLSKLPGLHQSLTHMPRPICLVSAIWTRTHPVFRAGHPWSCVLGRETIAKQLCQLCEIHSRYCGFHEWGTPIAGWFTMGKPTKMDDLGVPPWLRKPPYCVFIIPQLRQIRAELMLWPSAQQGKNYIL